METVTLDTTDTGAEGNTKILRARIWVWTLNNPTEDHKQQMKCYCEKECIAYVYQLEIGKQGTPHLQGYWEFKNPRYFTGLKKDWPTIHLEKCRDTAAAKAYCQKDDTKAGPTERNDKRIRKITDPLANVILHPWQQNIKNMLTTVPDNRTIHWIYDSNGNMGKTTLAKHLCIHHPGKVLYMSGKSSDIKYGVKTFLDNPENDLKMVIFDFTRTTENFISYQAMEEVKNGLFYNTKYESCMCVFDSPHIVVMANFKPNLEAMSTDRWNITELQAQGANNGEQARLKGDPNWAPPPSG